MTFVRNYMSTGIVRTPMSYKLLHQKLSQGLHIYVSKQSHWWAGDGKITLDKKNVLCRKFDCPVDYNNWKKNIQKMYCETIMQFYNSR